VVADAGNGSSAFFGSVTNYGRVVGSGTASFLPSGAATINLEAGDSAEYINTGKIIFGGSGPLTFVGTMPVFNDVDIVNTNAAGVTPNLGWTINGTLTIAAGRTFHAGAGLVHTVVGEVITNGTFDGGTSTMVLGSPSGTNVTGSSRPTFYNLTIAGRVRLAADIAISRDFTNNGDFTSNGYQVEFIGSEPSVITGTASPTPIRDFHIEKVGSTVTAGVDIGDVHHLDMMSGTFDLGTHAIASGITADTLTMLAGTTLRFGGTSSLPSFPVNVIDASSTVEYYGSGSQTITATRYGSLLSSSTGARILDPSGPIYVEGAFTPGSNSYTVSGSTMVFANDGDNADDSVQAIPAFNYYNLTGADESPHILDPTGVIGIAGTFTPGANTYAVAGSTVDFNGGSQTIPSMTFDNVRFTSSGTKTAAGALTATGDLTIGSGTTLNGGSFTHVVQGNWTTNGTFAPATSTVRLTGADPATIAGVTAFNACEVTKADAATTVTLGSDVTAATVNVNVGRILTGANTIEITSARTGNGIILGTIKHTHPFVANTAYAFEGPNNLLTFTNSGTLPTSVTVTVATASPGATASMDTIGRYYRIAQSGGSGYHYALRLHYDDNEIAAPNTEGTLKMWLRTTTSPDIWTRLGTTAGDTVNNWVAYSGLNSVGTFSLSSHSYPEMALALLQDVDVAAPADEVIYTVNYHNVGDGSAGDAIVTVSAPTHTSYVPGSVTLDAAGKTDAIDSDEVSVNGSTITVNLSAVPAGASGTITYRVRVE
jgi:uncharacterized repeat protein (TIGR01451 family)